MKVLFVCTGNTCRSPIAGGLFEEIIRSKGIGSEVFKVESAGLMTIDGLEANEYAVQVLSDKGIDISGHRSKRISDGMIDEADLILTMTDAHKNAVTEKNKVAYKKTFTLKEYANYEEGNTDIEDPFGMDLEAYKQCAEEILIAIELIANKIIGEQE